ncbi:hypothetical protein [Asanoa iriomotensis]|uniref:DUF2867 domain-containing protein n=1 Tax=Asanoa iriomotensis TaxID=234613 RepID=A0ABQ4BZ69_9ACTN|nr:hypothetical protein [Asanoa iriomotensis]GIF55833.1 hypothetical protein Air01nite_19280 [Asanoa iriomotensis]
MTVDSMVGTSHIPAALHGLPHVHYADRFTLTTPVQATPESWARAMFGDTPSAGELLIWRGILALRLSREASVETVAGWRITEQREEWIRLAAASWWLDANMVVVTTGGQVSLWTFLHYAQPVGHVAWPPLSIVHRQLVPGVLRAAAARVGRR